MTEIEPALRILDAFTAACSVVAAIATLMLTHHYSKQWEWPPVVLWQR